MKPFLLMTAATSALMLAACGNENAEQSSYDNAEPTSVTELSGPELGDWGVDLTAIKESVKPGDNFFKYASGTWLDNFEIPADRTSYGAFTVLAERSEERVKKIIDELANTAGEAGSADEMVGDLYKSYMDIDAINARGLDPLKPLLSKIDAISDVKSLTEAFGRSNWDGIPSPISHGVGISLLNPDNYEVVISLGGLGLPDRDYYLEDNERFNSIRDAYKAHIAEMLTFAGYDSTGEKASAILAIETKIAEHQWPRADRRDRDKINNPMTVEALKVEHSDLDWDTFFGAAEYNNDTLNVRHPSAIGPLVELITGESLDTWKAYIAYHAISNHAGLLSEEIDEANFNFYGKTLRGQQEQRERWKRGVARVGGRGSLGMLLGQIYVERYFPESAKTQMVELVENLRTALGERIKGLEWMGPETREKALEKLAAFRPKIGYPDVWEKFDGLEIKADDLFANSINIRYFNERKDIADLAKVTDKERWGMTPQTVNAYYNPSFNEIVFPAAILQAPFFDPEADAAVNYGGIGAVIGHEMGHGFDDQGSKSDAKGVLRNWWTDDDRANFDKLADALVDQYNGFEAVEGNFVDGRFTLGENIGDVGGLAMAYHAYKLSLNGQEAPVIDGLTGDQRFFLSWAQVWKRKTREEALVNQLKSDPHSPGEFRVNGVLRNMDAWYEAFSVTQENALYLAPEDRVQIW